LGNGHAKENIDVTIDRIMKRSQMPRYLCFFGSNPIALTGNFIIINWNQRLSRWQLKWIPPMPTQLGPPCLHLLLLQENIK